MAAGSEPVARWVGRARVGLSVVLLLAVLTLFHWLPWQRMFESGFDSADDAYFAMIAKELAVWGKYGFPISWNNILAFDPGIGSGPALILPLALYNLALGPGADHPALVVIFLFLGQILALIYLLSRQFGIVRSCLYGAASIFVVTFFKAHFDIFGIVLGEPTMLGFLLLAMAILSRETRNPRAYVLGGLCLSAAILTKQSAIVPAFGILAAVSAYDAAALRRQAIRPILHLALATAAPLLLFEAVKLATLGPTRYIGGLVATAAFQETLRVGPRGMSAALQLLSDDYSIGPATFALAAASALLVLASKPRRLDMGKRLVVLMAVSATCTLLQFALSGFVNPRYLWSAAMTTAFLIPIPILATPWPRTVAAIAAILLVVGSPLSFWQLTTAGVPEDGRGIARERSEVVDFLNRRPDLPIYGLLWHSSFDIFYFLPPDREWHVSYLPEHVGKTSAIYVFFGRYTDRNETTYRQVVDRCERKLPELTHFEIYVCEAPAKGAGKATP